MCCALREHSLPTLVDKDTEQRCILICASYQLSKAAKPALTSGTKPQMTLPMPSHYPSPPPNLGKLLQRVGSKQDHRMH